MQRNEVTNSSEIFVIHIMSGVIGLINLYT